MSTLPKLSADSFAGLPIGRYEIHLRAEEAAQLPAFPGSALRGAFGHALKTAVCVMNHRDCERCLVVSRCIYPYVFETPWPPAVTERHRDQQNAPHPYLLDPPVYRVRSAECGVRNEETQNDEGAARRGQWAREVTLAPDDEIVFGLTLFGQAIEHLPFLIYAVHEMAERGLSVRRHRFELAHVDRLEPDGRRVTIYTGATQQLAQTTQAPPRLSELIAARVNELALPPGAPLRLRFVTPLRIRVRDDLQARLSFELLTRNLLRRVSMLLEAHGSGPLELDYRGLIERAAQVELLDSRLRWWDLGRWSNRQQTSMKQGGMVGESEFGAGWEEFLPLVAAGELVRVGNGTSFGLGKYEMLFEH
jgi:hypothetical protein